MAQHKPINKAIPSYLLIIPHKSLLLFTRHNLYSYKLQNNQMSQPSHQMRSSRKSHISSSLLKQSSVGRSMGRWLSSYGVLLSSFCMISSLAQILHYKLLWPSYCWRESMQRMMLGTVRWYFIIFWWWLRHWSDDRVPTSLLTSTLIFRSLRTVEPVTNRLRLFSRKDLYFTFSSIDQLPIFTLWRFLLILSSRFLFYNISWRWVIISYSLSLPESYSAVKSPFREVWWVLKVLCITGLVLACCLPFYNYKAKTYLRLQARQQDEKPRDSTELFQ